MILTAPFCSVVKMNKANTPGSMTIYCLCGSTAVSGRVQNKLMCLETSCNLALTRETL